MVAARLRVIILLLLILLFDDKFIHRLLLFVFRLFVVAFELKLCARFKLQIVLKKNNREHKRSPTINLEKAFQEAGRSRLRVS